MPIDAAYCVCTTEKTKTRVQMSGKFKHNLRLHDVKNADPSKRHLNEILIGDDSIREVFNLSMEEARQNDRENKYKNYIDYAEETKWMVENATGRKVRKDAVLEIEVVLTYSHTKEDAISIDDWKKANVEWVKKYFGEENVISAVLHQDEATPHIHVMVTPIDRESGQPKFNAKKWLGGRALMAQMQTDYAKAMEQFGLRRGEENTRASHQDLQTFYRALNNVCRQKLPERSQFLNDQAYQTEIDNIYRETVIRMFALEQSLKRLEDIDRTREGNTSTYRELTEARIKDYEEQMEILQSNLSEAEKKARIVDHMQTAIQDIARNDPNKAQSIRDNLNALTNKGGALERAMQRRKAAQSAAAKQGGVDIEAGSREK
ncbi:MAG: plasmid recombination protein [Agathobacter sp.]|nr:plasmid recombination protein [Agathobacter sp.]